MPRVKRKGHMKRDTELPLSEWPLNQLKVELQRLETDPVDLSPWAVFKRKSELQNELFKRTGWENNAGE